MKWLIAALGMVLFLTMGCSSSGKTVTTAKEVVPLSSASSVKTITVTAKGGLLNLDSADYFTREFDRNGDKKPDIVNVYKKNKNNAPEEGEEALLFIKIMDLNLDGKYDVYRFYDEAGAVVKEELDLDFDGKIETTDTYLGGIVIQKEIDSQFDEKTDLWKFYDEKGVLIRLEEDQDGNGRVDYWEFYSGGVLERVEKDTDHDGRPDIFKRAGDQKFTTIIRNDGQFGSDMGPQTPDGDQQKTATPPSPASVSSPEAEKKEQ